MHESAATILIIDNDEDVVGAIVTRLQHCGYVCLTASTGAAGLDLCRTADVDLVITDLNMPMGDGIALATSIRRTMNVPIIVITGFHDEYKGELRQLRDVAILRKPFATEQLVDLVETEISLHDRNAAHQAG